MWECRHLVIRDDTERYFRSAYLEQEFDILAAEPVLAKLEQMVCCSGIVKSNLEYLSTEEVRQATCTDIAGAYGLRNRLLLYLWCICQIVPR